jgi:multiple sugar transport system ATP-binding protein
MALASIDLQHVGKRFGPTEVIRDVSLDIPDGEFCVLVGPSGSGKSTLLRMIAGLESVSEGAVHIDGRDVTHLPPKDRDIAMVFQSYALYPQMTVRENMGFGLKLLKRPADEIRRRVDQAAQILDLAPLMDRRPAALSGGQRQRVAMGRAMVREPAAFLFDEPLSNLDAALRASVRGEIRALHSRLKTTSVYVTHDQIEAMTMGDRIVVLRAGRVEQAGTPVSLYEEPVNRFVAGFIGSPAMNFCECTVQRGDGSAQRWAQAGMALPAGIDLQGATKVVLGMRPEHLELGAVEGAALTLQAQVVSFEFTGAQTQLTLDSAAGPLVACVPHRPNLAVGDRLAASLPPGRLHVFDAGTEQRLAQPGRGHA